MKILTKMTWLWLTILALTLSVAALGQTPSLNDPDEESDDDDSLLSHVNFAIIDSDNGNAAQPDESTVVNGFYRLFPAKWWNLQLKINAQSLPKSPKDVFRFLPADLVIVRKGDSCDIYDRGGNTSPKWDCSESITPVALARRLGVFGSVSEMEGNQIAVRAVIGALKPDMLVGIIKKRPLLDAGQSDRVVIGLASVANVEKNEATLTLKVGNATDIVPGSFLVAAPRTGSN